MSYAEHAEFIRNRLDQLGVRLPPGSRFDRMLRIVESPQKPTDLRGVQLSQQAVKDVQEMNFILRRLFVQEPTQNLINTLRDSLGDDPLPVRSAKALHGRNAQAELYVGAVLCKAGLRPRKYDPPDYLFTAQGADWAVEVKRLQTEQRIEQRVREGFAALADSQSTGILFLDLSQALRSRPTRLTLNLPSPAIREIWGKRLREFVHTRCNPAWLRGLRKGHEIRGVILLDNFVAPDHAGEWCFHSITFGVAIDQFNQRRKDQFDRLWRTIMTGTATAADLPV